jgi:hypothetical protein
MPWPEQDSILANLPKLVQFLSTMVKDVFSGTGHIDSQENYSNVHQQQNLMISRCLVKEALKS